MCIEAAEGVEYRGVGQDRPGYKGFGDIRGKAIVGASGEERQGGEEVGIAYSDMISSVWEVNTRAAYLRVSILVAVCRT